MNKKILSFIAVMIGIAIIPFFVHAESIVSFDVDVELRNDASAIVEETIVYDFEGLQRHGIYRTIQESFVPKGAKGKNDITVKSVVDQNALPYMYKTEYSSGSEKIRIGDPNKYVTGENTYVITYEVQNAIGFFEENDEFYWNLTGSEWEVDIHNVSAKVKLADSNNMNRIFWNKNDLYDYCGFRGVDTSCGTFEIVLGQVLYTMEKDSLRSGENITIDLEFPKGHIIEPTVVDRILYTLSRMWYLPLPFMIAFYFLRKKFRKYATFRKFKKNNPLVVQYDPDDYSLLEASLLHDGWFERKNISALLVWYAVCGYMKIHHTEKKFWQDEYTFTVLEKGKAKVGLSSAEGKLLETFDGVTTSSKKKATEISSDYTSLLKEVKAKLIEKGLLHKSTKLQKNSVRLGSRLIYVFLFAFLAVNPGVFVFALLGEIAGVVFSGTMVILAICNLIIPSRPDYTEEGLRAEQYINGLYMYIDMAESDRINTLNNQAKTPELYEKLLPYAMLFGLEMKWTEEFAGVLVQNPSWYTSNEPFTSASFAHGITALSGPATTASVPSGGSSGGGGFSGGGGGGGGGGSW